MAALSPGIRVCGDTPSIALGSAQWQEEYKRALWSCFLHVSKCGELGVDQGSRVSKALAVEGDTEAVVSAQVSRVEDSSARSHPRSWVGIMGASAAISSSSFCRLMCHVCAHPRNWPWRRPWGLCLGGGSPSFHL